jgi:hypothetical protein
MWSSPLLEMAMSIKEVSPGLPPSAEGLLQPLADWPGIVGKSLMLAYFYQWQWLTSWQRALGHVQQECLDQWICRFGGGAPLDG